MPELSFFDCHCMVGRWTLPSLASPLSLEDLKRDMKNCGISRSLVFHALAKEYDPKRGNDLLMEAVSGSKELEPCWVVVPEHTREMPPAGQLIEQMRERRVGAVRLFPRQHQFLLNEAICGSLLQALAEAGTLVLLDIEETSWQEVDEICSRHPSLNLVLLRIGYRCNRYLFPLLRKHQNLRIEISYYQANNGIEHICREFGPERMLFGTGYPLFAPGAALGAVTFADLSEKEKALIASGNLENLLRAATKG